MEQPETVPLGSLKPGDLLPFLKHTDRKLLHGERLPAWEVNSIGQTRCGVILQKIGGTAPIHSFSVSPLMLVSSTLVVQLSDQFSKGKNRLNN
jgi:hypothetical protein